MGGGAPAQNFAAGAPAARFNGGGNWNGGRTGWNGGGGYRHHGGGFWPGAVAGAVVGGVIGADSYAYYGGPGYYDQGYDSSYYDNGYSDDGVVAVVPGGGDPSYCAQRYRSYDPASGTYLGFDGLRHPCP
jgi:hypothetical protein